MAEDEEMDINSISMVDVLEEEKDLEEDARAVLGGSDPKNCTFVKGYVKRQALYSCLTCMPPETGDVGGLCLACSLACHEGHNLVELYTKRNFRCDCGNRRYQGKRCTLEPNKTASNELNTYNHNFSGKYCSCSRPYPDPEEAMPDQMIQCVICEDWFHGKHLQVEVPDSDDYGEMICYSCSAQHAFLKYYVPLKGPSDKVVILSNTNEHSSQLNGMCVLNRQMPVVGNVGTMFLEEGWRQSLCRCQDCKAMYVLEEVSFLIDPEDTVQSYEEMGKVMDAGGSNSQYEQGMIALSQLDRVKQVEAINGYNHMKLQLMEFLKTFADNKQVVREEDIRKFFTEMQAHRQPPEEPPHFCR